MPSKTIAVQKLELYTEWILKGSNWKSSRKCISPKLNQSYIREFESLESHKFHNEVKDCRPAKAKNIDDYYSIPNQLKFENVLTLIKVVEVAG